MDKKMRTQAIHANYSNWQLIALTSLRVMIGWHFLYEGLIKLYTPEWTSKFYLMGSVGPMSSAFRSIARSEIFLQVIDICNVWGLLLIGLSLFIGLFSKYSEIFGVVLLMLYYLAYPPFAGLGIDPHIEGSYWVVNKNLIEMGALLVLYFFPSSHITGFDRFLFGINKSKIE